MNENVAVCLEASEAAKTLSPRSNLIFLLQVSRPGLWSTTALFYLLSSLLWIALFRDRFGVKGREGRQLGILKDEILQEVSTS